MNNNERQPVIMADKNKLFGFIDSTNIIPIIMIIIGGITTWSYVNFSVDQLKIDVIEETLERKDADEELGKRFAIQFAKYEAVQIENQKEMRSEFRYLREGNAQIQRDLTEYLIGAQPIRIK